MLRDLHHEVHAKPIGRLLRAATTGCVVGCKVSQISLPAFGGMVLIPLDEHTQVYGLIYDIHIDDDGLVRQLVTAESVSQEVIADTTVVPAGGTTQPPEISLVIPGLNEAASLPELAHRIHAALAGVRRYELIFIDDGSTGYSDTGMVAYNTASGYQGDVHYTTTGYTSKTATWSFGVLPAGTYRIAILGDSVNYSIGHYIGPRAYDRPDSRWFKQAHLRRTQQFYEPGTAVLRTQMFDSRGGSLEVTETSSLVGLGSTLSVATSVTTTLRYL